jgi:hypothetical protein
MTTFQGTTTFEYNKDESLSRGAPPKKNAANDMQKYQVQHVQQ